MNKKYRDLEQRLLANSVLDLGGPLTRGTECWNWLGYLDRKGYGRINVWCKKLKRAIAKWAHRAAYEWFEDETIPPGMELDHECRNPSCINPGHMEVVTKNENVRRQGVALYGDRYDISEFTEETRDHESDALQNA